MEEKPILPFGTRTFIMGIINLTPDSFSGDGLMKKTDVVSAATQQAAQFVKEGADILDLGAESTRPGSEPVSEEIELERLLPAPIRPFQTAENPPAAPKERRKSSERFHLSPVCGPSVPQCPGLLPRGSEESRPGCSRENDCMGREESPTFQDSLR